MPASTFTPRQQSRLARMFGVQPSVPAQHRAQVEKSSKELGRLRGEIYLDSAQKYLEKGDCRNALATAQEGLRMVVLSGPQYLAVGDQLKEFLKKLEAEA